MKQSAITCPHLLINASLERWDEAHWFIHQMETYFHKPDQFRYSANAFIRSIKEIPQILKMEMQNHKKYKSDIKPCIDALKTNNLFYLLSKKRDYIVHQGSLKLHSKGMVGTTEGRGFKIGLSMPIPPEVSSDQAYGWFKDACKNDKILRGAFGPDCDSSPCIERSWKISEFPDEDLLEVCIKAWKEVSAVLSNIIMLLDGPPLNTALQCCRSLDKVKLKVYSQADFFSEVDEE